MKSSNLLNLFGSKNTKTTNKLINILSDNLYYITWIISFILIIVVIAKIFFSDTYSYLENVDIFVLLLACLDFIVISKYLSPRYNKFNKLWIYLYSSLFIINYIWFVGESSYSDLSIYPFQIELHTFLIVIGISFLPQVRSLFKRLETNSRKDISKIKKSVPNKRSIGSKYEIVVFAMSITIIVLVFLNFAVSEDLGKFVTVDEHRWIQTETKSPPVPNSYEDGFNSEFINSSYERSIGYWDSYLSGNISGTFNNANPSATTSFLHLPAYLFKDTVTFSSYLVIARVTMIIHALLMLFIIFHSTAVAFSRRIALLVFGVLGLSPLFIGYSRLINHDSIQGLYGIIFLMYIWAALKYEREKYFKLGGVFLSLAILTQFKSEYLIPILWFIPILITYTNSDKRYLKVFFLNLKKIVISAFLTSIVILPAILVYPQIFVKRFLFYPNEVFFIATVLLIYLVYNDLSGGKFLDTLFSMIKRYEKIIVRVIILVFTAFLFLSVMRTDYVFQEIFNFSRIVKYQDAIIGSFAVFFYSSSIILLIILAAWIYKYLVRPKIDYSFFLTTIFFFLLLFGIYSTKGSTNGQAGYLILGIKYVYVLLPVIVVGIVSAFNWRKISLKIFSLIIIIIVFGGLYASNKVDPFFIHYNNDLLPSGYLITKTTWGVDTAETSKYINRYFDNVTIYNPRGQLENVVKNGIKVLPWYSRFWEYEPDYIIVEWEKTHIYSKVLDYYRNNNTPIWSIEKNGVIYTGIYKFDSAIDYEQIIEE